MEERKPFDKSIEAVLLENGFGRFSDWKYGPQTGYSQDFEHYTVSLMEHNFGYFIILSKHASGRNPGFNIGSSNDAQEILDLVAALRKLW